MFVEVTPCILLFNIFFQAPERRSQTLEVQVDPRARSFAGSSRQNSVPLDQDKASPPMARSKGMSPMAGRGKGKLGSRSFSGGVLSSLDRDGLPNQAADGARRSQSLLPLSQKPILEKLPSPSAGEPEGRSAAAMWPQELGALATKPRGAGPVGRTLDELAPFRKVLSSIRRSSVAERADALALPRPSHTTIDEVRPTTSTPWRPSLRPLDDPAASPTRSLHSSVSKLFSNKSADNLLVRDNDRRLSTPTGSSSKNSIFAVSRVLTNTKMAEEKLKARSAERRAANETGKEKLRRELISRRQSYSQATSELTLKKGFRLKEKVVYMKEVLELKEIFDGMDLRRTGFVTVESVQKSFGDNYISLPVSIKRNSDDQSLSFKDFLKIMLSTTNDVVTGQMAKAVHEKEMKRKKKQMETKISQEDRDMVDRMWQQWDPEDTGELDKGAFKRALETLGVNDVDDFEMLYDQIDLDGGGTIDKVEFIAWWFAEGNHEEQDLENETP